tara:strand:- start:1053 stop:1322 length:270 start_codon:yes stop_codon:yes gene_type:complete
MDRTKIIKKLNKTLNNTLDLRILPIGTMRDIIKLSMRLSNKNIINIINFIGYYKDVNNIDIVCTAKQQKILLNSIESYICVLIGGQNVK